METLQTPSIGQSIGTEMVVKTTTSDCPACAALREKAMLLRRPGQRPICQDCQRAVQRKRCQRHREKIRSDGASTQKLPRASRTIVEVASILGISCSAVVNAQGSAIRKLRASRGKSMTDLCEEAVIRWERLAIAMEREGLTREAAEVRRVAKDFAEYLWGHSMIEASAVEVVVEYGEVIGGSHDD